MNLSSIVKTAAFCALLLTAPAFAQTVEVTQNMNFGTVSLTDNASQRQIAFQTNGTATADPQYYFIDSAVIGQVDVTDFPAGVDLIISITPDPATLNGPGNTGTFSIDDYFIVSQGNNFTVPATINTPDGTEIFYVGAILRSQAGAAYNDSNFTTQITVQVECDENGPNGILCDVTP